MQKSPDLIVIGNSWAALAAVSFAALQGREVTWVAGSGVRMFAALPSLETGAGVELWARLARMLGIMPGEALTGSFLREFRNKAFREPAWTKAPTAEARLEVLRETLWGPERSLVPLWETRFETGLAELEHQIRDLLTAEEHQGTELQSRIRLIEGVPVQSMQADSVTLASGEQITCSQVIYADRWSALPGIQGLPKNLPFIRGREPAGVLQAIFEHEPAIGHGLKEGFFGPLHKESGEEFERHIWGHFSVDGKHSYWTVCLTGDEVEDNHQIGKKLRRAKNALDKMFAGESWLPEGKTELMQTVQSETVRFYESVVFAEGEAPTEPVHIKGFDGLSIVTDGYGPARAIELVAQSLGLPLAEVTPVGLETSSSDDESASPEASPSIG